MALNFLSVVFLYIGQHYQNKWIDMFNSKDKAQAAVVEGFRAKDRKL